MTYAVQSQSAKSVSWIRRLITYAGVLLLGFALGYLPMWAKSRAHDSSLAEAKRQAGLSVMQNSLASAAIDAQRGDYESALQETSSFFTSLRAETENPEASALSPTQKEEIQPLFVERDDLITLLAQRDPASAERLFGMYVSYRQIMSK